MRRRERETRSFVGPCSRRLGFASPVRFLSAFGTSDERLAPLDGIVSSNYREEIESVLEERATSDDGARRPPGKRRNEQDRLNEEAG